MSESKDQLVVPSAAEFRAWLENAIAILSISPHSLSISAGVSTNAVRKFIALEYADLRLETANKIYREAVSLARKAEKELPRLPSKEIFQGIDAA